MMQLREGMETVVANRKAKREIMAQVGKKKIENCPRILIIDKDPDKWVLSVEAFNNREKVIIDYRPASQRWKRRDNPKIAGQGVSTLFSYLKLDEGEGL